MSVKKTIGAVLKIAVYVICAVLAALIVFIMISNAKKNVTFMFGHTALWVMTDSMETGIPAQSYILVKKVDAKDVKLNDVITFYSDDPKLKGALNTHRVVEIIGDKEEFVTKGDNNAAVDKDRVKAENVVAVYVKKLPVLSAFGRFMATKTGIIVMVVVIFALIIAVYVPDIIKSAKARDAEQDKNKDEEIQKRIDEEVERLKKENGGGGESS